MVEFLNPRRLLIHVYQPLTTAPAAWPPLYPEVFNKIRHFKCLGRHQRPTPAGDIYAAIELMTLPGRRCRDAT